MAQTQNITQSKIGGRRSKHKNTSLGHWEMTQSQRVTEEWHRLTTIPKFKEEADRLQMKSRAKEKKRWIPKQQLSVRESRH